MPKILIGRALNNMYVWESQDEIVMETFIKDIAAHALGRKLKI